MTEEVKEATREIALEAPEFARKKTEKSCCGKVPAGDGKVPENNIFGDSKARQIDQICGPCQSTVPFCCTFTVNERFIPAFIETARLVYDVSQLCCFVEECRRDTIDIPGCPSIPVTLFQARVRGCIKFIASQQLRFFGNTTKVCGGVINPFTCQSVPDHQDRTYVICCQECVSVDQVLKVFGSQAEAQDFCDRFNGVIGPGLQCPDVLPAPDFSVSAQLCFRQRRCGTSVDFSGPCPSPLSGNFDAVFCGLFTINFPDC